MCEHFIILVWLDGFSMNHFADERVMSNLIDIHMYLIPQTGECLGPWIFYSAAFHCTELT